MRFLLLLVVLLTCAAPAARGEGTPADLEVLRASTAEALAAHAKWCTKKKLFGKRDETYEVLLTFDPDHAAARKKLKYEKAADGSWKQDKRYKRAKNLSRGSLKQEAEKLAAILAGHRAQRLDIYGAATRMRDILWARRELTALMREDPAEKRIAPILRTLSLTYYKRARERALVDEMADAAGQLRRLYPEDREVRRTLGEVKHDDRWMLAETARTRENASRLDAAVEAALKAVGVPGAVERNDKEKKIKLPWAAGVATADIRAMGTVDPKVLAHVVTSCQVAGPVFQAALEEKPERREDLTLYLFGAEGEIDTFLKGYPVVDNPSLQQRKELGLDLVYADGRSLALKKNQPFAQVDLCTNTVLNQMFSDTFLEGGDPKGWHAEGISRYLAYRITGTRYSISMAGSYAGQGGDRPIPDSKEDWLARAHGFTSRNVPVGLALMLGKGLDAFEVRDAVISYAFAVFLIEGHDKLAAPFIRTLAKSADADKTCREILGTTLPMVEYKFKAWLNEMTIPDREARR